VAFLLDALNAVTGNLDVPGGAVFGDPPIALDEIGEKAGLDTYGKIHSRFGGIPDVLGNLPATLLPKEITTPGERQIRALFVSAGNPSLSVPDGDALDSALEELDLMVSLDLYVNETNRHADYVLPATTFLEREDVPVALLGFYSTPFMQVTEPVVEPSGEARQEWQVIDDLSRRIGVAPYSLPVLRRLARIGIRITPRRLVDGLLRIGRRGDLLGLRRSGLSVAKMKKHPHGVVLDGFVRTGVMPRKLRHRDKRVHLRDSAITSELDRLTTANGDSTDFPLKLIGMRELRSHNSWMHNAALLMRGGRSQPLRVHPDDARGAGLDDGDLAAVTSASGAIRVPVQLTDEMTPGTVALPHGWGHRGGWRLANAAGGANFNQLAPSDPDSLERLAGMAHLTGIPVRVARVEPADVETGGAGESAAPSAEEPITSAAVAR
jgi:formate dehydrogenase